MKRILKKTIVLAIGWAIVLLGVAGLFLPLLQGILFILIGLFILSYESEWAQRMIARLRRRYPRLAETVDRAELRAKNTWSRLTGRGAKQ